MPNWNDPNSIKQWLAAQQKDNGDYGQKEQKAKADARIANEQRAADRASSSILKPLVSGSSGRETGPKWENYDSSPTGRKRQEPQQRQRIREPQGPQDDRTRIGNIPSPAQPGFFIA